jgi:hypothetical protein
LKEGNVDDTVLLYSLDKILFMKIKVTYNTVTISLAKNKLIYYTPLISLEMTMGRVGCRFYTSQTHTRNYHPDSNSKVVRVVK